MIRSLLQYAGAFAHCGLDRQRRALLGAHAAGLPKQLPAPDVQQAMNAVADHLAWAQDQGGDDGIGSYHLVHGWGASYPETTGYIIPSLLAMSHRLARPDLLERALRAADWLLGIQHNDGGWPGGRLGEGRPPVVFNTAQVVRGLMAVQDATDDDRYGQGAVRACDWIVAVQEADGTWARHNFLGTRRVYDAYVDAPLMHMAIRCGEERYRAAAQRNLEQVLSRQRPNGWFADADNTIRHNSRPITHTIAYTIDGLIECHQHGGDARWLEAAAKAASALRDLFLEHGGLHGRYNDHWRGSESPLTTGDAQLAIAWSRLASITGEAAYTEAAGKMVSWLVAVQHLSRRGPRDMHGAVTGSYPLWGRYEKFACPNWAQKYLADALLCTEGHLPRY